MSLNTKKEDEEEEEGEQDRGKGQEEEDIRMEGRRGSRSCPPVYIDNSQNMLQKKETC